MRPDSGASMRPRGGDGKKKGRGVSAVRRRTPHDPYGIVGERIVWASAPATGFEPGPPATGRACCRYTSRPSAGRPRTGVCHHPSGWSAVDRVLPALRHAASLSRHDGEARPPRGCDGTHRPAPPRSPVSDGNTRGATPSVSLRDSTGATVFGRMPETIPTTRGSAVSAVTPADWARAARGDSGNSSHCWVGEPPHPAHEMGC